MEIDHLLSAFGLRLHHAGIKVVKIHPSNDYDNFDHAVDLEKGFQIQVPVNGRDIPTLYRRVGEELFQYPSHSNEWTFISFLKKEIQKV